MRKVSPFIAIVAATEPELEEIRKFNFPQYTIKYFTHGVGSIAAALQIQKVALEDPDLIIQCGIAGAYNYNLAIGETVVVENEMIEMGAEEEDALLDIFDLELEKKDNPPFEGGLLPCYYLINKNLHLKKVKGLTVNTTAGIESTIKKRREKYNADIETMEGAALHYVCLMMNIPFLQIKTISNYVEKRNKLNWNIPLALKNNATEVKRILEEI